MAKWITVKEASIMINVHDRTIRRYVSEGKLKAKKEGNRVLIDIDSINDLDRIQDHRQGIGSNQDILHDRIKTQQEEIEFLRERVRELDGQRSQETERADTIILQLTRQLEQSQRLLEYHQEVWYRRWFRKKGTPEQG